MSKLSRDSIENIILFILLCGALIWGAYIINELRVKEKLEYNKNWINELGEQRDVPQTPAPQLIDSTIPIRSLPEGCRVKVPTDFIISINQEIA